MERDAHTADMRVQIEINDNISIHLFGITTCKPGWFGYEHSHDFWELINIYAETPNPYAFIIEGYGELRCDETALFLMPPHTKHVFRNLGSAMLQNIYVGFSYVLEPARHIREGVQLRIMPDHADSAQILSIFSGLAKMPLEKRQQALNSRRADVMNGILSTVKWITEEDGPAETGGNARAAALANKAKEYILANLERHISIDELARQMYLSTNYLGQIFRQATGETVKSYHNRMRMERALWLLGEGTHTISDVADLLGFESVAYFSRRFKELYGFSPSQALKAPQASSKPQE